MKRRLFIALMMFLIFSTYTIQENFKFHKKLIIQQIIIDNNYILNEDQLREKLSFLYGTNIFFLKTKKLQKELDKIDYIESFQIKKIYPSKIKITINEKKPIAIIQNKKEKKLYTSSGDIINFFESKEFDNLPLVFGEKKNFQKFFNQLKKTNFPIKEIKTYYLFESKRWDLVTINNQIIKLPIKNYTKSLKNFIKLKDKTNFYKYKIFDYRINNQLILK